METSYDVRIWKIEIYSGRADDDATRCAGRWPAGRGSETFRTAALADAFRSELVQAARRGEAFGVESGRPVSMERARAAGELVRRSPGSTR